MNPDCSFVALAEVETRATTGELRLVAAVLKEAVEDARRGDASALAWIASDAPVADGFSFVAVCEYLDVDPGWLRALIARSCAYGLARAAA